MRQKSWRMPGGGGQAIARRDENVVPKLDLLLRRWLADPVSRRVVLEMCRAIGAIPSGNAGTRPVDGLCRELLPKLRSAFSSGQLVAFQDVPHARTAAQTETAAATASAAAASSETELQTKTWIGIRVVEERDGSPVPGVALRVVLPGGVEVSRTTNADGETRIGEIDPGSCRVSCDLGEARLGDTGAFAGMGEPAPAGGGDAPAEEVATGSLRFIAEIEAHKVAAGESLDSLAKGAGLTWQKLSRFNFGTDKPTEINKHLRSDVGCTKKTRDGYNYMFDESDDPGIVYIPKPWEESGLATGQLHVIRVARHAFTTNRYIWIEVHNELGLYESTPYRLEVSGLVIEASTTAEGVIEAGVPKSATRGKLTIDRRVFQLDLIDEEIGDALADAQIRLRNLGFECGPIDGIWGKRSRAAMTLFQSSVKLPPTGEPDDDSLARLKNDHDQKDDPTGDTLPAAGDVIQEDVVGEEIVTSDRPEENPGYFS